MFFAEYVQKMREIEDPQKGQYSFMLDFLGHCFLEKHQLSLSETSAKRYFKGKTEETGNNSRVVGDTIGHFASKHKKCFDSARLTEYIRDITKNHTDKNIIINYYKCDIPDLTEENYPEKLADLCKRLLDNAAGEVEPTVENTEDKGDRVQNEITNPESINSDLFNLPQGVVKDINEIIITLLTQLKTLEQDGKKIADWVLSNSDSMLELHCELWNGFMQKHQEFQNLNNTLHVYFNKYNCRLFEYTLPFENGIKQDHFWRRHLKPRNLWIRDREPRASDYIDILKEISNELDRVLKSFS